MRFVRVSRAVPLAYLRKSPSFLGTGSLNPKPTNLLNDRMNSRPQLQFKIASEDWEIELIHHLNYKTFVKEIPQHEPPQDGRLVDKFHAENTYVICLCGQQLAGMLALRARRWYSLKTRAMSFVKP